MEMKNTRTLELEVELIEKIKRQLRVEIISTEKELRSVGEKYNELLKNYNKAKAQLEQLDVSAEGNQLAEQKGISQSDGRGGSATGSLSIQESIASQRVPAWEQPDFQWRRYLPSFIEEVNEFVTTNQLMNMIGMDEEQRQKHYSTVSSALSVLAKEEQGKLVTVNTPHVRGQLYGLPSFLDEAGSMKPEYADKARRRGYTR